MAPLVDSLRASLAALSLDTRGHKSNLIKRLAKAKAPPPRKPAEPTTRPAGEAYDSFLLFDVEATCERIEGPYNKLAFAYANEIIEWPVVLLRWVRKQDDQVKAEQVEEVNEDEEDEGDDEDENEERDEVEAEEAKEGEFSWTLEVVDEYHSFVKPTWKPTLSAFCTELTGIQQSDIDAAPTYSEVLLHFEEHFIAKHNLFTRENKTAWVTDGPWDLRDFISKASHISGTPRPSWLAGTIIDLRLLTSTFFSLLPSREPSPSPPLSASTSPPSSSPRTPSASLPLCPPNSALKAPSSLSLPFVLAALSLPPFIGRLHSGLYDARNGARILVELARRGTPLLGNRVVPEGGKGGRERRWGWMEKDGGVGWEAFLVRERAKMGAGKEGSEVA